MTFISYIDMQIYFKFYLNIQHCLMRMNTNKNFKQKRSTVVHFNDFNLHHCKQIIKYFFFKKIFRNRWIVQLKHQIISLKKKKKIQNVFISILRQHINTVFFSLIPPIVIIESIISHAAVMVRLWMSLK